MKGTIKVKHIQWLRATAIVVLLSITGFIYLSFRTPEHSTRNIVIRWASQFEQQTQRLEVSTQAFKLNRLSVDSLRAAVTHTREVYKRIEFILNYYYPEYAEEHLNGAPLLHIERGDTRAVVVDPEGLQVLDEMAYGDDAQANRVALAALAQKLKVSVAALCAHVKTRDIPAYAWVEAQRLELIRVFTLGLTGFDTPGSQHAQQEAAIALSALRDGYMAFMQDQREPLPYPLTPQFDKAIVALQQPVTFNDFDRLAFLRDHINPLYTALLRLQTTFRPVASAPVGWNTASDGMFSNDFLDPYYFTELARKDDSPALRSLGQTLFYDPILSNNASMSCASCHNPAMAFTDGKSRSASAVQGVAVQRNAPTLINAVYADRYFYDLRAFSLEQQAEHVIFNRLEFNTAHDAILQKLIQSKVYPSRFREAFGSPEVTRERFAKALVSYVLSLRSFNSVFDRYARGESNAIAPEVAQGFNLFMGKANCGTCHFAPVFSGLAPPLYFKNESEILGVPQDPASRTLVLDADKGRYDNALYGEQAWIYERSFKTTSVRNVALTAPYFHNGAYKTLEDVVDFYDHGGGAGRGMKVINQTLPEDSLYLSVVEKKALVSFMRSLTDTTGMMHTPKPNTY